MACDKRICTDSWRDCHEMKRPASRSDERSTSAEPNGWHPKRAELSDIEAVEQGCVRILQVKTQELF